MSLKHIILIGCSFIMLSSYAKIYHPIDASPMGDYIKFNDFNIRENFPYTKSPYIELTIDFSRYDNKAFPAISNFNLHLLNTTTQVLYKNYILKAYCSLSNVSINTNDSLIRHTTFIDFSTIIRYYMLRYKYQLPDAQRLPRKLSVTIDFDYMNGDSLCHYNGTMIFRRTLQGTFN